MQACQQLQLYVRNVHKNKSALRNVISCVADMYLDVYIDPPHAFDLWHNRKEARVGANGKLYPVDIRRLEHVQNTLYHEMWTYPTKECGKRTYQTRPPPQRRTMCILKRPSTRVPVYPGTQVPGKIAPGPLAMIRKQAFTTTSRCPRLLRTVV